ncbi:hypothetical protein VN97_g6665 [Penicillium thymicola]|uniref:Uncharacterized protein n=1 Tax=Penicillium thymicola TaxID=293382 RepID=A0AAI9TH22_PENTH|nr:hypothetical protein VN97_g6665 [Penicillium thymicola]
MGWLLSISFSDWDLMCNSSLERTCYLRGDSERHWHMAFPSSTPIMGVETDNPRTQGHKICPLVLIPRTVRRTMLQDSE